MVFWFLKKNKGRLEGRCIQCGRCCRSLILFQSGNPVTTPEQMDQLIKKKPHFSRFKIIGKDQNTGYLTFSCDKIGPDNLCTDYSGRPDICKIYPESRMFKKGGNLLKGCGFQYVPKNTFSKYLTKELKKDKPFHPAVKTAEPEA